MIPDRVTLVEVGPRDGLQNEGQPVSTAQKVELIHRLQAAGSTEIEATSFVSPKWVPQMADNAAVMAGITRKPGVRWSVLTPNLQGLEGALASRVDEVVVFAAATEAFSRKNINCSIEDSIERFRPVVEAAHAAGVKVRGAISCALGCPYQGAVSADEVERVVLLMKGIGVDHCGVADTIGTGTPRAAQAALERALKHYPLAEVDDVAVAVAEDLDLDVPRPRDITLDQHVVVAEGGLGLALAAGQRGGKVPGLLDTPHALAAAAGAGLDEHRVADAVRLGGQQRGVVVVAVVAGHQRHAGTLHQRLGRGLAAHGLSLIHI